MLQKKEDNNTKKLHLDQGTHESKKLIPTQMEIKILVKVN
jgi:hypothetical protein